MKKIVTIIGALSIIAVMALATTYYLNVKNIEEKDRNVESYHDYSPYIYMFFGVVALISAYFTFHFHVVAGIIPFGLGALSLIYGLYLALIKGGLL